MKIGEVINATNSNNPMRFSSNETNNNWGFNGISNNIQAANSSNIKGGSISGFRKKIKNIANKYKIMKSKKSRKLTLGSIKRKLSSILNFGKYKSKKNHKSKKYKYTHKRRHHKQRGGNSQYMNNVAYTPSYSTAGQYLSPDLVGMANPPPITMMNNCPK